MMRTLAVLAVAVLSATSLHAQFGQLVTPDDGSQVVFSSKLSLKSAPAHDWSKLFQTSARGVQLLDERLPVSPPAPLPTMEAFYELVSRDQSSDGLVQALNTYRPCAGGSRCVFVELFMGEIRAPGGADPLKRGGILRLSPDGRYAFNYGSTQAMAVPAIWDLWTNSVAKLQQPTGTVAVAPVGRRVIANNGTAVYIGSAGAVVLADTGGVTSTAKTTMPASAAIIEPGGRFLVYETAWSAHQLMLYDLDSEWELPLVWAEEGCTLPALSDDARHLLFLSAANWEAANDRQRVQAWLFDLTTGELRQLTRDVAGITEATLSGNGQVVWAVTLAGRLLHVDVDSRTNLEVVGRTVALDYGQGTCARGSQCELTGRGLAPEIFEATAPLPVTLGGIELKIDGMALPLISVAPDEIRFVLPWDLQPGTYQLELTPGDSVFQEKNVLTESVTAGTPSLYLSERAATEQVYALHDDFHGPVTSTDPARPGEVVHLYAAGLGPVTPAVPVGIPAPSEPLARTVLEFGWSVRDGTGEDQPAEVLFSGLAPNQFGVYQVDVRLPAKLASPDLRVTVSRPETRAGASALLRVLPNTP